jgi:ABC-type polysaccharide/polyol phosphate export permease
MILAPGSRPEVVPPQEVTILTALKASLIDVVGARDLLLQIVYRDIRIRYKQSVMGLLWAVFMPVLVVMSGLVVRVAISQLGGAPIDREVVGGLVLKSIPWGFVVGALGFATTSLVTNANLVSKVYFPREVLPIAAVLGNAFDSGVALLVAVLVLPFLGATLSFALLWAPLLLVLLFVLTLAVGLMLACSNVFLRDVRYVVQVLLTFGIFFTPVFYEPAMLGEMGSTLVMANPIAPLLEGLRLAVIEGHNLLVPLREMVGGEMVTVWQPWYLLYSGSIAILGLLAAAPAFRAGAYLFAEYI